MMVIIETVKKQIDNSAIDSCNALQAETQQIHNNMIVNKKYE